MTHQTVITSGAESDQQLVDYEIVSRSSSSLMCALNSQPVSVAFETDQSFMDEVSLMQKRPRILVGGSTTSRVLKKKDFHRRHVFQRQRCRDYTHIHGCTKLGKCVWCTDEHTLEEWCDNVCPEGDHIDVTYSYDYYDVQLVDALCDDVPHLEAPPGWQLSSSDECDLAGLPTIFVSFG